MAIIKRSKRYQVKLRDSEGKWIVRAVRTRKEAEGLEAELKNQMREGHVSRDTERLTVDQFYREWFEANRHESSQSGWRAFQAQYYRDYIAPVIGAIFLKNVTPAHIQRIFVEMTKLGRAPQTQRLIYSTVRKLFGDAVEYYQYLVFNPVLKKLKPVVPIKEAAYLTLEQIVRLLRHVRGEKYGVGIWLQTYLGLRISELQGLRWTDVDLETGIVTIRQTFVRKTGVIRDYPKGKKQHSHRIPSELVELLGTVRPHFPGDSFVVVSPSGGGMLPYRWYNHALQKYCRDLGLPRIGTHGLRHSASQLYLQHGASKEDLKELFAHSGMNVTERYIHNHQSNLDKVAGVIRLF